MKLLALVAPLLVTLTGAKVTHEEIRTGQICADLDDLSTQKVNHDNEIEVVSEGRLATHKIWDDYCHKMFDLDNECRSKALCEDPDSNLNRICCRSCQAALASDLDLC